MHRPVLDQSNLNESVVNFNEKNYFLNTHKKSINFADFEKLKEEYLRTNEDKEILESELANVQEIIEEYEIIKARHSELEKEHKDLENLYSNLKNKYTTLEDSYSKLNKECFDYQAQVNFYITKLGKTEKDRNSFEASMKNNNFRIESLGRRLDNEKSLREKAENELKETIIEYEKKIKELSENKNYLVNRSVMDNTVVVNDESILNFNNKNNHDISTNKIDFENNKDSFRGFKNVNDSLEKKTSKNKNMFKIDLSFVNPSTNSPKKRISHDKIHSYNKNFLTNQIDKFKQITVLGDLLSADEEEQAQPSKKSNNLSNAHYEPINPSLIFSNPKRNLKERINVRSQEFSAKKSSPGPALFENLNVASNGFGPFETSNFKFNFLSTSSSNNKCFCHLDMGDNRGEVNTNKTQTIHSVKKKIDERRTFSNGNSKCFYNFGVIDSELDNGSGFANNEKLNENGSFKFYKEIKNSSNDKKIINQNRIRVFNKSNDTSFIQNFLMIDNQDIKRRNNSMFFNDEETFSMVNKVQSADKAVVVKKDYKEITGLTYGNLQYLKIRNYSIYICSSFQTNFNMKQSRE